MKLVLYPDIRLVSKCCRVLDTEPSRSIKKHRLDLAQNMWKIMMDNNGIGLASPQVGLDIRMFVWKEKGHCQAIWNPVLKSVSGCKKSFEGCLSLPGVLVEIERGTSSILHGTGINGRPVGFTGDPNTTRIWQHEIYHLDGKLIIDNMSHEESIENKDALRKLLKNRNGE